MTKKNRLFEVKLLLKAKWPALHGEMADRGHSNFSECDEECLNCLRISIMTYGTSKFCAIIQNFMLTKLETGTFVNMLVCLAKVLVNRIKKRERRTIESISLSLEASRLGSSVQKRAAVSEGRTSFRGSRTKLQYTSRIADSAPPSPSRCFTRPIHLFLQYEIIRFSHTTKGNLESLFSSPFWGH